MKRFKSLLLAAALAMSVAACSAGLAPWEFGMSKAQVNSFEDYGPYRTFSNGDLETYAGLYDGKKENVQFFFKDGKLGRIGIYLYEGTDAEAARQVWKRAYQSLARKYGQIETPGITPGRGVANDAEALSLAAAAALKTAEKKVQMAPARQPAGMSVFSSYFTKEVKGTRLYWVTIILDPRP